MNRDSFDAERPTALPSEEILLGAELPSRAVSPTEPFDADDLRLIADGSVFEARARVMTRMREVFEALRHRLIRHLARGSYLAPKGADRRHGKFGRGEYLEQMPYVYLDLPRYFDTEAAFTFRALFWWGHGVSFSLILGGPFLTEYRRRLLENLDVLQALDVHVSMAEHPWDWGRGDQHTLALAPGVEPMLLRLFRFQNYLKCVRYLDFQDTEFREGRIAESALLTFQAFEPIILR